MTRPAICRSLVSALLLGIGTSACSSGDVAEGEALTQLELQSTVSAIFNQAVIQPVSASVLSGGVGVAGPSLASVPIDSEVEQDVPCTQGGVVETFTQIQGTFDDETGVADLSFFTELDHVGCVEGSVGSGVTVELEGAPGIRGLFDGLRDTDGVVTVQGGVIGIVNVVTESANVNCDLNVEFTAEGSESGIEYGFLGQFCELGIQGTFTDDR